MCKEILSVICIGHLYSIPFVARHCTSSLIAFIYCRLKQNDGCIAASKRSTKLTEVVIEGGLLNQNGIPGFPA
jgi:hypothetical protein